MSKSPKIPFFILIAIMGALILLKPTPSDDYKHGDRGPASIVANEDKWATLRPSAHDPWRLGKAQSFLLMNITSATPDQVIRAGQTFTLHGHMTVNRNCEHLQWEWSLPAGVVAVSGNVQDEKWNLKVGDRIDSEITLVANHEENSQIHLHAYEMKGNEKLGNVAQYNTHIEALAPLNPSAQAADDPTVQQVTTPPKLIQ